MSLWTKRPARLEALNDAGSVFWGTMKPVFLDPVPWQKLIRFNEIVVRIIEIDPKTLDMPGDGFGQGLDVVAEPGFSLVLRGAGRRDHGQFAAPRDMRQQREMQPSLVFDKGLEHRRRGKEDVVNASVIRGGDKGR